DQRGKDRDRDGLGQEAHGPVAEKAVGAAGVHAVHLPLIGAIDGTGSAGNGAVVRRSVNGHVLVPVGPDAAVDTTDVERRLTRGRVGAAHRGARITGRGGRLEVRTLRPSYPELGAVGALDHAHGVRQPVGDV